MNPDTFSWVQGRGPALFIFAMFAPFIGVSRRRPSVAHAITLDANRGPDALRKSMTGACGARFLHFVKLHNGGDEWFAEWPPQARGPWQRCGECWDLTGRKRPRTKAAA